jgi:hypothetical protein
MECVIQTSGLENDRVLKLLTVIVVLRLRRKIYASLHPQHEHIVLLCRKPTQEYEFLDVRHHCIMEKFIQ